MAYIYKIENKTNKKMYIGKTRLSLIERWREHVKDSRKIKKESRPLYSAIKKYGAENFNITMLEETTNELSAEREVYWIKYYSTYENGYNATRGGDGNFRYNHDDIVKLLKNGFTAPEISNKIGCCKSTVRKIAKRHEICINGISGEDFLKARIKVLQYDYNFLFIKSFKSIADAARWCAKNNRAKSWVDGAGVHISDVCKGRRKTAYGFIWRYD